VAKACASSNKARRRRQHQEGKQGMLFLLQKAPLLPLRGNSPRKNPLLRKKRSARCGERPKALPLESTAFEKAGETLA